MNKIYFCIDLKTFYASVECVVRHLDPFSTPLVVADPTRGNGAICLAISPCMKELGVKNRCRIFEIPKGIEYLTAMPRMKLYIQYSANIYAIYLKYVSKDDIHVYSIDEAFLDVSHYLKAYNMNYFAFAEKIIQDIYKETGITATCGIGTNLYLAKISLDIIAKKNKSHIAFLNEDLYIKELSNHRPLTDFWQIGRGIQKKLSDYGIYTMEDIRTSDEKLLYKMFGINAEYLLDHAYGREPTTIKDIKAYKSFSKSVSSGQVLFEDYPFEKALLVLKEMVELTCIDLTSQDLVSNNISLYIGYSKDTLKSVNVSCSLTNTTNSFHYFSKEFEKLFRKNVNPSYLIRRINISFNNVVSLYYEQYDLFTDSDELKKDEKLQKTISKIKDKYGKSSIFRGMNLEEGATTLKRNKLIGGHNGN